MEVEGEGWGGKREEGRGGGRGDSVFATPAVVMSN